MIDFVELHTFVAMATTCTHVKQQISQNHLTHSKHT